MLKRELNIDLIKDIIKDDYLKSKLRSYLDLIIMVEFNYTHIDQLETLQSVLEGGLTSYYKEYHKDQETLAVQCGYIAKELFLRHYKTNDSTEWILNLYKELIGEEPYVKNFKEEYYKQ